jgi:chemotaxis-related protein WspD
MSDASILGPGSGRCWTHVGVWGNSTCSELPRVFHCRNCEVYSAHGRVLLDRPAPKDYLESWSKVLAEETVAAAAKTSSYLVFRVGQTWFAFLATSLHEITAPSVIRSVPHRPREILQGLVNVRGELHPCICLHTLFGEQVAARRPATALFLVARWAGEVWVFPVDQVDGIRDITEQEIEATPLTVSNLSVVYAQSLFRSGDHTVAIVNESLLFGDLARRIA